MTATTNTIQIRPATRADVPAILEISNHFAVNTIANFAVEPEPLDPWLESFDATAERFAWLVATDGERIVGFAKASPWKGRCAYVHSAEVTVYLEEEAQGRGLGRRLYARLFELLQEHGFRSALGGIALPNDASVALHESMGMKQVARFERIGYKFGAWHDVGYWQILWGEGAP